MIYWVAAITLSYSCWISKHGNDGMGHQLQGIITIAALGPKYAPQYPRRSFSFAHISGQTEHDVNRYFQSTWALLRSQQLHSDFIPSKSRIVVEIWKVPDKCDQDILYKIDNVFFHPKGVLDTHFEVPSSLKRIFKKHLPPATFSSITLVVHIRLGDSGVRGRIGLQQRLSWIRKQNIPVIIHTDDSSGLKNFSSNVRVYGKEFNVLEAFSQMVHAPLFLGADSSLSMAAAFLRDGVTFFDARHVARFRAGATKDHGAWKMPPHIVI